METIKLYYENAFLQDFTAVVESCGAVKGGFAVVLDRTAFYPEGGGQPYDTGILGGAHVTAVHDVKGEIVHYTDAPLTAGETVVWANWRSEGSCFPACHSPLTSLSIIVC